MEGDPAFQVEANYGGLGDNFKTDALFWYLPSLCAGQGDSLEKMTSQTLFRVRGDCIREEEEQCGGLSKRSLPLSSDSLADL